MQELSSSKSSSSASDSGFTHAFVNTVESDFSNQPSVAVRNNLFVGSSDDVMNRVRYRPVDTRGDGDGFGGGGGDGFDAEHKTTVPIPRGGVAYWKEKKKRLKVICSNDEILWEIKSS